jgi:glycosyltransferase involved in cell wall biosynthesis
MHDLITPLILTFNEAPNIRRTLEHLSWAREIVVLDSYSTDGTLDILAEFPQVRLLQRKFDSFAGQCNFGLHQITTEWVLSLDADYVVTPELSESIQTLNPGSEVSGYRASFTYCILGRPLRASLYPPRTVLYRKDRASYADEGHGHRVRIEGTVVDLVGQIQHDDRKPLDRWLAEQSRYMVLESKNLTDASLEELSLQDKFRKRGWPAPILVMLYCLFAKGLILDGWPGWFYTFQRTLAETLLALRIIERKLGAGETAKHPSTSPDGMLR